MMQSSPHELTKKFTKVFTMSKHFANLRVVLLFPCEHYGRSREKLIENSMFKLPISLVI